MNTPANDRDAWILKMADIEDNCDLTVGGLAHEVGMLAPSNAGPPNAGPSSPARPAARTAEGIEMEHRRVDS